MRELEDQFAVEVWNHLEEILSEVKRTYRTLEHRACKNLKLYNRLVNQEKRDIELGHTKFETWLEERKTSSDKARELIDWIDSYYKGMVELVP